MLWRMGCLASSLSLEKRYEQIRYLGGGCSVIPGDVIIGAQHVLDLLLHHALLQHVPIPELRWKCLQGFGDRRRLSARVSIKHSALNKQEGAEYHRRSRF